MEKILHLLGLAKRSWSSGGAPSDVPPLQRVLDDLLLRIEAKREYARDLDEIRDYLEDAIHRTQGEIAEMEKTAKSLDREIEAAEKGEEE